MGVSPPDDPEGNGVNPPAPPSGVSPPAGPSGVSPPDGAPPSGVNPAGESIGASVGSSSTSSGGGAAGLGGGAAGLDNADEPFQGPGCADIGDGLDCAGGSGESGVRPALAVRAVGAGGAAAPPGICTTAWQCGHFPFFPAALIGVRTVCPHEPHGNEITAPLLVALPAIPCLLFPVS